MDSLPKSESRSVGSSSSPLDTGTLSKVKDKKGRRASQVASQAVAGEEGVPKNAPLDSGRSIRSILSTKAPTLARLGAAISGLWFRTSLTDKKAQAAVAHLGEKFGNLAANRSFRTARPEKQGEQIVALIASPNTRLALVHFAKAHMLEGPHKEEFLALLDELGKSGHVSNEQKAMNCIRAAKIIGMIQNEAHFDKKGEQSSLPRELRGNGDSGVWMARFTEDLIQASRSYSESSSRALDQDICNPNVLLTTEGLTFYAEFFEPTAVSSMLKCDRATPDSHLDALNRLEKLVTAQPQAGANSVQKMAYGHLRYHQAERSLSEMNTKKDRSTSEDFNRAGQHLAAAATYLGLGAHAGEAIAFFNNPPENPSSRDIFENYAKLATGLAETPPFNGLEGLGETATLARGMQVIAEVQTPIRALATCDPSRPTPDFIRGENLDTFGKVVAIMSDGEQKEKASSALKELENHRNGDPISFAAFDLLNQYFEAVAMGIKDNPDFVEGFKADITHLKDEFRTQHLLFQELNIVETLHSGTDSRIMQELRSRPYIFEKLINELLQSSPAQAEEAKKFLDKASSLADKGKQAESFLMLSRALNIVIDHTPPARKMHAFQAVRDLRDRLLV